jgi:hypothetical protein
MNHWFSTLTISSEIEIELEKVGILRWPKEAVEPTESCLLLYDSLDRLVSSAVESNQILTTDDIINGLTILSKIANSKNLVLMAGWRILALGHARLKQWLDGDSQTLDSAHSHPSRSGRIIECITYSLVESKDQLVNAYNTLELQAELLGSEPHLNYKRDWQRHIDADDPLPNVIAVLRHWGEAGTLLAHKSKTDELEQNLKACLQDLNELRGEVELATRSVLNLQAELEKQFIADKNKQDLLDHQTSQLLESKTQANEIQRTLDDCKGTFEFRLNDLNLAPLTCRENAQQGMQQMALLEEKNLHQQKVHTQTVRLVEELTHELAAARAEISVLKHIHQENIALLKEEIRLRDRELDQSVEAVEIIRVRLEEVQTRLEDYFIQCRQSQSLILSQSNALGRAKVLLARLRSDSRHQIEDAVDVHVEVMPLQASGSFASGVQEHALIESYSKSLDRALSLLKRAVHV